jgi:hypothetical protein
MKHPLIPSTSSSLCNIVDNQLINQATVQTTYKIKDGRFVKVISTFDEKRDFKDAIFPAALESAQQELHA